jgi:hypothetical protein
MDPWNVIKMYVYVCTEVIITKWLDKCTCTHIRSSCFDYRCPGARHMSGRYWNSSHVRCSIAASASAIKREIRPHNCAKAGGGGSSVISNTFYPLLPKKESGGDSFWDPCGQLPGSLLLPQRLFLTNGDDSAASVRKRIAIHDRKSCYVFCTFI